MELLLEDILNLIGFVLGLAIGIMSYVGFRNTGSPTLFRLSIAFFSMSLGFLVILSGHIMEERWVQTLGIGIQTIGYFFIAFSHSIKSFFPKNRYLRSVGIFPLLIISTIHIEHIFRATSFILLVYGAIETMLSFIESRKKGAILVSLGLSLLALGEFVGWYSFVFPESILYDAAIGMKISGLISLFIPVSKVPMTKIKFNELDGDSKDDNSDVKQN